MPSWFRGINAVLAIVATVATVGGTMFAILLGLGVVGGEKRLPEIITVDLPEATVGQQVDISGKNLDLVSKVLLTKGSEILVHVAHIPISESRLTVVVPDNVEPNRYNLEFDTVDGNRIATGRTFIVSEPTPTPAPTATPKPTSTPTPTPTATPRPTLTPRPTPTATLKATLTPTPTPLSTDTPKPTSILKPTPLTATPTPPLRPTPTCAVQTATIRPKDDHANDIESATSIPIDFSKVAEINYEGDIDYFSFEAQSDTRYLIETFPGSLTDPFICLYDSKGAEIASKEDKILWTAPSSGTHYIAVSARDSSQTGKYSVSVSIDTP